MDRIQTRRRTGLNTSALRMWGMLFVTLGVVGRSILQLRMLGMTTVSGDGLLALLESDPNMMTYATIAIVMQAMETCAVPIFAFLLAEGMGHTKDVKRYLLRLLGTAAAAEIPYNMAMSGKLLDFGSRNPVFGLVFAAIALWFCQYYAQKSFKNICIWILVTVCAAVWCGMLRVQYGSITVFITAVLWAFRAKPSYRNIAGATATIVCSLSSMFFMAAPMGFLAVFLYNGEEGELSPAVKYAAYPAVLLTVAVVGMYLL